MCRPSPAGLALRIGLLASASAVAACNGDAAPAPVEQAPAPAAAAEPARARPRATEELLALDLSDEAVAEHSLEELWELGVQHLGWPAERPGGATKTEIHQRLLEGKYRDTGDFGDPGY